MKYSLPQDEESTGTLLNEYVIVAGYYELTRKDERDLTQMVQWPTFLSLAAWRQVSETWLTKAITGPKSRGTSLGTTSRGTALNFLGFYANPVS